MSTILVVDDEPAIRTLVGRVLARHGHQVVLCQGSVDALAVTAPIDLLLVDHMLPGMTGLEVTELLRERWPKLPVVLMSGYPPQPETMPGPPSAFLQKPMLPAAVVSAIERLLQETRVPGAPRTES